MNVENVCYHWELDYRYRINVLKQFNVYMMSDIYIEYLKPANYACGLKDKSHNIYLLDFGIARMYKKRNIQGGMEIKTPRDTVLFKGTVRFASIACHRNIEMGPKDDCESWFYLLLDLIVPKGKQTLIPFFGVGFIHF
uniref:Protein kinase domain-containing protein n=1 Tax=Panagrolaimus superbus TaxID=310955 RepID=A0A914YEY9_9BILA